MGNITINTDALKAPREWKRHKIQDGSNVYRILPPFGDVEVHNNYPYRKWSIVWMVDPSRGYRTPFASPMTDGDDCPVKEYQDALKDVIENKKAMYKAEGMSETEIKDSLKKLHELQWQIKVQHVYAYNAVNQSGEIGLLEVKSTAHKGLKTMMMEYINKYGQDPTSLNSEKDDSGVWFNIKKTGSGKSTEYTVDFHENQFKDDDGDIVYKVNRSALPVTVVNNYQSQGYDLSSIYRKKTYNELLDILKYNLSLVAEECPEAILPGFELGNVTNLTQQSKTEEKYEQPVNTGARKKVNLNLNDFDDEPETVTRTSTVKVASSVNSDVDDIKDFADSILGD